MGPSQVYVEFKDRDRVPARIVGWDLFSDVAVVRVDPGAHALSPVPLGTSSSVVVGTPVAAIGSPFDEQSSLSVGVVSATDRRIDSLTSGYSISDAIQTDASINRGNSGGPSFDARGRVIGINAQIRSTSGTTEGVGFAIPIDTARRTLDQLVRTGKVSYAYVGVSTRGRHPGPGAEVRVRHAVAEPRRQGRGRHARGPRGASWRYPYGGVQRPRGGARRRSDRQDRQPAGRERAGRLARVSTTRSRSARRGHRPARRDHAPRRPGDACRAPA